MRTVFFGTPELAVPSLAAVAGEHQVTALVCQPDKAQGRSSKLVPPPTKVWAEAHGIAVLQPTKLNDGSFEAWLKGQAPEVCVLVAYGRILKQPILDVPSHGFLNLHPSLLPRHRGPSPIQTALLEGDTETGVTIMRLDAGTDTGDVVLQERAPIQQDDTTESLSGRLAVSGARLLLEAMALLESGNAVFQPQDHDAATYSRLYRKEDGRIRWAAPAEVTDRLVRAAVPWPVAHCLHNGQVVRIHRTLVGQESSAVPPGTVVSVERDRVWVATDSGMLAILEIQMPGKRAMTMGEHLRGHGMKPGDRFEDCV